MVSWLSDSGQATQPLCASLSSRVKWRAREAPSLIGIMMQICAICRQKTWLRVSAQYYNYYDCYPLLRTAFSLPFAALFPGHLPFCLFYQYKTRKSHSRYSRIFKERGQRQPLVLSGFPCAGTPRWPPVGEL